MAGAPSRRFYSQQQGLPVITPKTCDVFIKEMCQSVKEQPDPWIWDEYGGKLARTFQTNKQRVLFPVGLQYGWNVYDNVHRELLLQVVCAFRPKLLKIHVATTRAHALSDTLPRGFPGIVGPTANDTKCRMCGYTTECTDVFTTNEFGI